MMFTAYGLLLLLAIPLTLLIPDTSAETRRRGRRGGRSESGSRAPAPPALVTTEAGGAPASAPRPIGVARAADR
jgi:hypothetical protein